MTRLAGYGSTFHRFGTWVYGNLISIIEKDRKDKMMHIQIKGQITINTPADKAWRVLAYEFGNIGHWATAIAESAAVTDQPGPDGSAYSGRVCTAPGFGDVQENFTYYDEARMRFGYIATRGLPGFITRAENNWSVRSLGLINVRSQFGARSIWPGFRGCSWLRCSSCR